MTDSSPRLFLPRAQLQDLIDALIWVGYRCVGPQVKEGAIAYEPLTRTEQLPIGMRDEQGPGHYRLQDQGDQRMFAWANGAQSLKPWLFTPREVLWQARLNDNGLEFEDAEPDTTPTAVIGTRACDLAAMRVQDLTFVDGPHPDPYYQARRDNLFLVAVHCTHAAATCFCASTGDGPRATHSFDIAMTELDKGFVAEAGSERGQQILDQLNLSPASEHQTTGADQQVDQAAQSQIRALPGTNLRDMLFNNLDHARWDDVAERCLSCANCTMVCPTCFCHSESEHPSLDGSQSEHVREWDSCFTRGHSYIHGITIREDTRSRYRQWLTHKVGSWHDQFGVSGCVGCGRCITWCPVGIDLVEELHAIYKDQGA